MAHPSDGMIESNRDRDRKLTATICKCFSFSKINKENRKTETITNRGFFPPVCERDPTRYAVHSEDREIYCAQVNPPILNRHDIIVRVPREIIGPNLYYP